MTPYDGTVIPYGHRVEIVEKNNEKKRLHVTKNEQFGRPEMSLRLLVESCKMKGSMEKGVVCLQE